MSYTQVGEWGVEQKADPVQYVQSAKSKEQEDAITGSRQRVGPGIGGANHGCLQIVAVHKRKTCIAEWMELGPETGGVRVCLLFSSLLIR